MKKIIFFIILLLFLISCKRDGNIPKIQVGTDALKIDFLQQSPPGEVHPKDAFNIIAEIKNIGTHNIENGLLVLNVDDQYTTIIGNSEERLNLEGKSIFNSVGGFILFQKKATAKQLPAQQERMTAKISIGACFKYSTIGGIDACIDTTPEKISKKVCVPKNDNIAGGQGAPVAITRIESKMLPNKNDDTKIIPEFIIYFQNLGNGIVINKEKVLLKCSPDERDTSLISKDDYDLINVRVSIPQGELTCNKQSISLQSSEKKLICKYETDGGLSKNLGTFTTSLSFELNYGYFQTAVKQITISKF